MYHKTRKGGLIGVIFALLSYFLASEIGFNQSSFLIFLYMYVLVGIVASLDFSDLEGKGILDRIVIVSEEEELKMKKIISQEEYKLKGTIEKI